MISIEKHAQFMDYEFMIYIEVLKIENTEIF